MVQINVRTFEVKSADDLLALGGKFYTIAGVSWCDLPTESWFLRPGIGYVRYNG